MSGLIDEPHTEVASTAPYHFARFRHDRVRRHRKFYRAAHRCIDFRDEPRAPRGNVDDLAFETINIALKRDPGAVMARISSGGSGLLLQGHLQTLVPDPVKIIKGRRPAHEPPDP